MSGVEVFYADGSVGRFSGVGEDSSDGFAEGGKGGEGYGGRGEGGWGCWGEGAGQFGVGGVGEKRGGNGKVEIMEWESVVYVTSSVG